MTNQKSQYNPKLKSYHIILIATLLSPLIILNSNYVNQKRLLEKNKMSPIEEFPFLRKLNDYKEDTNSICSKGSEKQKKYYETGNLEEVGIKEEKDNSNEERPKYIESLINVVRQATSSNTDQMQDDLIEYGKHLIPVGIFLVIAILSLPGWVVCCSCCCCKCCCCCCCKKAICKLPFFIITYTCYAIVLATCLYGLAKSDSIFVGLADTECSLLRFVGEVLDGESKTETPKWGGIETLKNKLEATSAEIDRIKDGTVTDLTSDKNSAESAKGVFEGVLHT